MNLTTFAQSETLREWGAPQEDSLYLWRPNPRLNAVSWQSFRIAVDESTHWNLVPRVQRGAAKNKNFIAAYTLFDLLEWAVSELGTISVSLSADGTSYASVSPAGTNVIRDFGGDSPIDALMNLITSVVKGK